MNDREPPIIEKPPEPPPEMETARAMCDRLTEAGPWVLSAAYEEMARGPPERLPAIARKVSDFLEARERICRAAGR